MTCTTNSSMSVNENSPAGTNVGQGGIVQRRRQQLDHRRGRRQFFHHQQRLGQGEVRGEPGLRDQEQLQRHGQIRRGEWRHHLQVQPRRDSHHQRPGRAGHERPHGNPGLRLAHHQAGHILGRPRPFPTISPTTTCGTRRPGAVGPTTASPARAPARSAPASPPARNMRVQVRGTDAEGTGAWSGSGTAITQYTTQTRSIAENSAAGTNVGAAVDADSNPNGHTLSYSLSGTDASSFSINASTGRITVGTNTNLGLRNQDVVQRHSDHGGVRRQRHRYGQHRPQPQRDWQLHHPGYHQRDERERRAGVRRRHYDAQHRRELGGRNGHRDGGCRRGRPGGRRAHL